MLLYIYIFCCIYLFLTAAACDCIVSLLEESGEKREVSFSPQEVALTLQRSHHRAFATHSFPHLPQQACPCSEF